MIFPTIQAENLEGRVLTLPIDLEGAYNVLFIAFQRDQQVDIDRWLPAVKRLVEAYPALAYYKLPTIYRGNSLFRWWVNTGMRMGIPDKKAREGTIEHSFHDILLQKDVAPYQLLMYYPRNIQDEKE